MSINGRISFLVHGMIDARVPGQRCPHVASRRPRPGETSVAAPGVARRPLRAVFLGSVAASVIMTNGAPYPTPFRPIGDLQAHYLRFPESFRVAGFLQVAAAPCSDCFRQ